MMDGMRTLIAVLALSPLVLAGCGGDNEPPTDAELASIFGTPTQVPVVASNEAEDDNPEEGVVEYRVHAKGSSRAIQITYGTGAGGIAQAASAALPWRKRLGTSDAGIYTLNAQNAGSGSITCAIYVDGSLVDRQTSTGPYSFVQCADPG